MSRSLDAVKATSALVEIARDFHQRGWMAGTAGNLSAREDARHFWITASGKPKGRLEDADFVLVRIDDGKVVDSPRADNKPSAETSIHRVLYALFPETKACLHGHSVEAAVVADRARKGAKSLRLPPLEMIKGFDIWQQRPQVDLPLFENHLDVSGIARDIEARFRKSAPPVTALLIRAHGPTVWGRSLQEAYNRFEILEYLLRYQAQNRGR